MLRAKHFLDDLEEFHPKTAKEAGQASLYSSALIPMIDYSIMVYCSAFNSSDRSKDGIGKFDAGSVFLNDVSKNEWHTLLKTHRDKNMAHITDATHKVWYLTSNYDRRLGSTGVGEILQNHIQPGSALWSDFRQHLEFTRTWFDQTAKQLRLEIECKLAKMPDSWFDGLPDPTENPLIAKSWRQLAEIVVNIAANTAPSE